MISQRSPGILGSWFCFVEEKQTPPFYSKLNGFDDVPVEELGAALLAGYGWVEGRGIGKNAKEDVKVKEFKKRMAKEGLGFHDDKYADARKEEEKKKSDEDRKRDREEEKKKRDTEEEEDRRNGRKEEVVVRERRRGEKDVEMEEAGRIRMGDEVMVVQGGTILG